MHRSDRLVSLLEHIAARAVDVRDAVLDSDRVPNAAHTASGIRTRTELRNTQNEFVPEEQKADQAEQEANAEHKQESESFRGDRVCLLARKACFGISTLDVQMILNRNSSCSDINLTEMPSNVELMI